MQVGSEECNIIDALADDSSRCESLKGINEQREFITYIYIYIYI